MTNNPSEDSFIELERSFHELSDKYNEDDDITVSQYYSIGSSLRWDNLLKESRVVILSEAGTGKTREIRNIARKLRSNGENAFFIRLEHIPHDFEDAFEEGSIEEFYKWAQSGETGWLFLDSVDEARLRDPRDFELAIKKVSKRLESNKQVANIIITGRASAWRPKTDLALCNGSLPSPAKRKEINESEEIDSDFEVPSISVENERGLESEKFRLVSLDDLNTNQIEKFIQAKGVPNTAEFMDAVERADAFSFTTRPQDLEELVEFWIDEGDIGSRYEIIENSITRRLKERDQNRAENYSLTIERARDGVKRIAAALTLCQKSTICVPDGAINSKGIAISEILTDWDEKDCSTIIGLPIFDEAIYGAVRFHHRSVREFLTAEWINDLLLKEVSRKSIEALFFRKQYGQNVLIPTMRPILPWLVILDEKIRNKVCDIAPEIILEGGDPSKLPFEIRRKFLYDICDQISSGETEHPIAELSAVQRFAQHDLSIDVKDLLKNYKENDELVWFLIRMVWQGRLKECLTEAKKIALSKNSKIYTRITAIRAVRTIGCDSDWIYIRDGILESGKCIDRDLIEDIICNNDPSNDSIYWLLNIIPIVRDKEKYSVDRLDEAVSAFVNKLNIDQLSEFGQGLHKFLYRRPIIERRHCEISVKYGWLMVSAAKSIERLINAKHPAALSKWALSVLSAIPTFKQYHDFDFHKFESDLDELIPNWPELNEALFWHEVNNARKKRSKKGKNPITEVWQISFYGSYWSFTNSDFDNVLNWIIKKKATDKKLISLSLAFDLYRDGGRQRKQLKSLKKVAAKYKSTDSRLSDLLHPPRKTEEQRRMARKESLWKRQDKARKRKTQQYHDRWRKFLEENSEILRNPHVKPGSILNAQLYLHQQIRDQNQNSSSWAEGNWKILISLFNEEIATAFRDGVVSYWRMNIPKLRSDNVPFNQTSHSVIFGLTGIEIEAREEEHWPDYLNEEEARIATYYATYELNGFPSWLPKLYRKFPDIVISIFLNEIKYELSKETVDENTHYIIDDIYYSGDWLWGEMAPEIYQLIESNEPKNLSNLEHLLNIIQGSEGMPNQQISDLASSKCNDLVDRDHLAIWYTVWTGVNPDKAISEFIIRAEEINNDLDRTNFAMQYVTNLIGGRIHPTKVREAFKTPHHLKTLYLQLHKYIRLEDDIDRTITGVYTPGLRDNAQESRNRLFTALTQLSGKEAYLAIDEISKQHPEISSRPWFAAQAKSKAEEDADITKWFPRQVCDFQEKYERTPSNNRDLFDLAVLRIEDLKDDLENGDSSNATIIRTINQETEVRKYIGNWLRDRAFGRYSIPQEEELADLKEPDLRFHGISFDGPVPIELKLADNWSGNDLMERLENQLCGDYLRDRRSNFGIFLLVFRGDKSKWKLSELDKDVDFDGLTLALTEKWNDISSNFPNIIEIRIIGIDLKKRTE